MAVFSVVDGVVDCIWLDVATPDEFAAKYGEFAGELVEGGAVSGQLWDGVNLSDPVVAVPEVEPSILNASRFAYLLAYTGLEEVWDALEVALRSADLASYALLKAQRAKRKFRLDKTLEMIALFRAQAEAAVPDVDLSEETIKAAWDLAATADV